MPGGCGDVSPIDNEVQAILTQMKDEALAKASPESLLLKHAMNGHGSSGAGLRLEWSLHRIHGPQLPNTGNRCIENVIACCSLIRIFVEVVAGINYFCKVLL